MESGSFFGEIALLEHVPRKATVICAEAADCLKLTTSDFENFLVCVPSIKHGLEGMVGLRSAECLKNSRIPFFEGLDTDKLNILAETCKIRKVEENIIIIGQGDVGESFYCIMDGSVNVFVCDTEPETGKPIKGSAEKCVSVLSEGQYFGELALISNEPRLATIKAKVKTILLEFNKEAFHAVFFSSPESVADFAIRLQQSEGFFFINLKSSFYLFKYFCII